MELGICLAGGGVKGAAHIGAIKALEESGIKFKYISGTSSGSIVATLYASGYSTDEIYDIFKKYCKKIKYIDIKNIFKCVFGIIFKGKLVIDGLNSGKQIEKLINKVCKEKGIEKIKDISMPLAIASVDMYDGSVYCFTSKTTRGSFSDKTIFLDDINIGKAVRASCSYPVVFSPCDYKNTKLLDGGIRENVPWKETKAIGADKVLSFAFESEVNDTCCNNLIDVADRSIQLLCRELSNYELNGVDYLIKLKSKKISLLDMSKIDELYEIGYKQTKEKIDSIRKLTIE